MQSHTKVERLLKRLFPVPHLWLWTRYEWEVGQTFNDPPDEYYLPWKQYWKLVK